MGNFLERMKDPHLVRSFQELLGVREISVEVSQSSTAPDGSLGSCSSAEDSSEETPNHTTTPSVPAEGGEGAAALEEPLYGNSDQVDPKKKPKKASLTWLKSKVRRRIRTPPLQHSPRSSASPEPPDAPLEPAPQVLVVETIPFLDIYFRLATELGYEPFYITFLPFIFWNIDSTVARSMIVTWAVSMYIGQSFKQLFKIRRPASPPAIRLEQNPSLETEYGFPSTHATVGTTIPFCLLYTTMNRYQVTCYECCPLTFVGRPVFDCTFRLE